MLLTLPTEVLLRVSTLLNFNDKLSLNATCRKLNDLISKTNLYEDLDFLDCDADPKQVIQEFQKKRFKGAQVKILALNITRLSKELVPQLSIIFPNVTRLISYDSSNFGTYGLHPISEPVATWSNTLKVLKTNSDWFPMWLALEHCTFPHLTELEIKQDNRELIVRAGFKPLYLVSFLKNVPSLERLTIKKLDISLDLLEEMHASCPRIRSLTLDDVVFIIDNTSLSETMIPATSLLYLKIDKAICFDKNGLLQDYILKKYPSLLRFYFVIRCSERAAVKVLNIYYPGSDYYYSIDSDENNNNTNEDSDEDDYIGIEKDEYQQLISNLKSALEMYQNNMTTFFSSLPKTIKILEVDTKVFNDIAEVLTKSDIKLVELNIRRCYGSLTSTLDQPNQFRYLKYLTSLKTMRVTLDSPADLLIQNFTYTSITKLAVNVRNTLLCVDNLFSSFPSLQDLCVTGHQSKMKRSPGQNEANGQNVCSNLLKITIKDILLHQGIFDFLKASAPSLIDLTLSTVMIPESTWRGGIYHFDMTSWRLQRCDLDIRDCNKLNQERHCKITIENTTSRFGISSEGYIIISPLIHYIHNDMEDVMSLNIKCNNIKDLKVFGLQIRRINGEILVVTE